MNDFLQHLRDLSVSLTTVHVGTDFCVAGGQLGNQITSQETTQAVTKFLDEWSVTGLKTEWAVVETLREIWLGKWEKLIVKAKADISFLARVRIFGACGDVDLRRDGTRWLWHFVGDTNVLPAEIGGHCLSDHSGYFYVPGKQALLWGQLNGTTRTESRVAAANLAYDDTLTSAHVGVVYDEYAAHGVTQFVRFRNIVNADSCINSHNGREK